ncbi:MAG TPA: aromatic acid exporter family protein [Chondromyces sp.]|nr:aromatic acid exporter family protein [Chondromyces sp.]
MFRIGSRTLKTAIGTVLAIMIAQWFGLQNYASAGIIAILCIQNTKKRSLRAAWSRFLACSTAILFSAVFFELISYHPIVIGIMLLFFIPTMVMVKAQEGIVSSSVIILHIFSAGQVNQAIVINELGIVSIGIIIALLMNLYIPSLDQKMYDYQQKVEENFHAVFQEIVVYLRTGQHEWDGKEIIETAAILSKAKSLAFKEVENHFVREDHSFFHYFDMREEQFQIIERMLPIVTSISHQVEQAQMIADFIEELSENIHPGNTAHFYLKKLYDMKVEFEQMELPKTREEFEARAALFQFLREMERYLHIKSSFKGLKTKRNALKTKITTS